VAAAARIVSLVPSLTELLFELGLGEQLVGRTGFCIHPRDTVRAVPKVGGTKDVDVEAVLALRPTHLVVNVDENEKPTVDRLAREIDHLIVTHPLRAQDNLALYRQFGEAFDCRPKAQQLCERFEAVMQSVQSARWTQRQVVYLIWKAPWMTVSDQTYIADMLMQVGLRTITPDSSRRYPEIDFAAWGPSQADAVLFSSEPYRFGERDLIEFSSAHGLDPARCRLIDGEMTSWYGSRAIEGLDYLARFRQSLDQALA
jgi:ABC-type Fe3+-hydroxamate transport system substrate-binding protein